MALATSASMPAFAQTEALDRATCHTTTGQSAIDACTRLLDGDSATGHTRAVLLNDRGLLFFNTGNVERAQADFDEAVKVAADLAPAWYNRGLLGARLGHFDQAIADFTRAGELAPQRAIIWQSRGGAYSRKGDDTSAIEDYSRAIASTRNWPSHGPAVASRVPAMAISIRRWRISRRR